MFEAARPFLLALAIGLLLGLERERAQAGHEVHDPLGSRTLTLLALLGAIAGRLADTLIAASLAVFAVVMIAIGYARSKLGPRAEGVGITTELAAMMAFALGYLAHESQALAVMLAVLTLVLLAEKPRIHAFARAGLTDAEVRASLAFLVIAFVVLPLLPDRFVDPWDLINPFRLWLLFVAISGISFGGYVAVRILGPARGLPAAGFSAGLVSSTAAAMTLARRSRDHEDAFLPAAVGIVLASVASAASQIVVVAAIFPEILGDATPVLGAIVFTGLVIAAIGLRRVGSREAGADFRLENPLAVRSSVPLAGLLAGVLLATSLASRAFGAAGILTTAVLGGAANSHAVTLAVSTLAAGGTVGAREAVLAILVGFASNLVVKLVLIAWCGGMRFLAAVAPAFATMAGAGAAMWALAR